VNDWHQINKNGITLHTSQAADTTINTDAALEHYHTGKYTIKGIKNQKHQKYTRD